jgi:hypothetical protein
VELRGKAVCAAIRVFVANGDDWREIAPALLSAGLAVFDGIPFPAQIKLLRTMNAAYNFAACDDLTLEMGRLQLVFLEEQRMTDECLQNLLSALQASPGNDSLRKMIADGLPQIQQCFETASDRGAELAEALIAAFEDS